MRQSVINYVKENGIKLAANSEDSTLRQMCQEVVAEAGKEQADSAKKPENHSNSARRGENERYQFHSIQILIKELGSQESNSFLIKLERL